MQRRLAMLVVLGLFAIPAFASLTFPPTVSPAFAPAAITTGQSSTFTITLTNPNSSALTGASLSDHIDPNLTVTQPSTDCPGGFVSFAGGTLYFIGSVDPNSSCTITARVTSTVPGVYQNDPGTLFSSAPPGIAGASAFLSVSAAVPALSTEAAIALAALLAAVGTAALARRG